AIFTFWLPLSAKSPAPPPPVTPVRSCRILVIDDEGDVAESLRRGLELYGHKVEAVPSGAAGITAASRARPDVVLCDLGMAETDGFTVAGTLRQQLPDTHL